MGLLSSYINSFTDKKRYYSGVSMLSFWDKSTQFSKKIYLAPGAKLNSTVVGDYTRIRHFTTISFTKIGKYTSISRNVRIGLGEHPLNLISTNSIFYGHKVKEIRSDWVRSIKIDEYKKVEIGNDVWIGEFVTIKGGLKIGDGAIIGTRAMVTKDVPPYAIVVGVPAKVVKYRFDKETINKLLEIKWWDLKETEIEKRLEAFTIFDISKKELEKYF